MRGVRIKITDLPNLVLQIAMSKAKCKYVSREIDDLSVPTDSQCIVRVLQPRGNNLHEVVTPAGEQYLVSMPTKFRKYIWVKRGDYVLTDPIKEGDKVKGEIVKILTKVIFLHSISVYFGAVSFINLFYLSYASYAGKINFNKKLIDIKITKNKKSQIITLL